MKAGGRLRPARSVQRWARTNEIKELPKSTLSISTTHPRSRVPTSGLRLFACTTPVLRSSTAFPKPRAQVRFLPGASRHLGRSPHNGAGLRPFPATARSLLKSALRGRSLARNWRAPLATGGSPGDDPREPRPVEGDRGGRARRRTAHRPGCRSPLEPAATRAFQRERCRVRGSVLGPDRRLGGKWMRGAGTTQTRCGSRSRCR
jgi:hypothetical protein